MKEGDGTPAADSLNSAGEKLLVFGANVTPLLFVFDRQTNGQRQQKEGGTKGNAI